MLRSIQKLAATATLFTAALALAQSPDEKVQATIDKGLAYLKSQQKPDGGWQTEKDPPAITALVLKAFAQEPTAGPGADFVKKGYQKLLTYQLDNGGVYKDLLSNYNTSIAVSALAAGGAEYKPALDKAVAYLRSLQFTEQSPVGPKGEKIENDKNPWYGGFNYGRHGRPDGSNSQIAIEALQNAGLAKDDPAFQAALKFVTRMQNRTESNDQPWAGDDGGMVYTPANNGESYGGDSTGPDGKRILRSYGSMTYAGLKSMIYAGLTREDPRVKAAFDWIQKTYTVDVHPGLPANNAQSGDMTKWALYYYYHTMARALNVYDQPVLNTPAGPKDWRVELLAKLMSLQKEDGSWAGEKKWMEDNPVLVTSYVVLALQEVRQDLKEHPAK